MKSPSWIEITHRYAKNRQINYYHARADIELRRQENGDEEAERWFARLLSGEPLAWNTKA